MKKIGITCYPSVGGSGIIATELGMKLAEKGHEIHFITSSLPFRLNQIHPSIYFHEVEPSHYPVFKYPPYDLALASKMAEVVDREKLDILHVHYAMPHAICAILARDIAKHDVKIVTTLHGTDITVLGIDDTFRNMIKYGIEQSDAVTAVSNNLVLQTKDMLGIKKNIQVVHNFINEEEYFKRDLPSVKMEYGINKNDKVIIHISNFRKVKRIEDIIYTFKKVNDELSAKLLLVGDGPEFNQIYQLVKELGLDDNVLFLGKQKNITDLLSISDLMLLLSQKESFGLVLLEAMACKVPCIGTNVGGIPEVIDHEKTGYIVELGDTTQAANYAIDLLKDEEKMRSLSENALQSVNSKFNSKRIVGQYLDLYEDVMSSTREFGDKNV